MYTANEMEKMFSDNYREKCRLEKKVKGLTHYIIKMKRKGYEEFLRKKTLIDLKKYQ